MGETEKYVTVRSAILNIIEGMSIDGDLNNVNDEVGLRDQLDLDSMDFLDIVMELKRRYKIEVPQADFPKFANLKGSVEYLQPMFPYSH